VSIGTRSVEETAAKMTDMTSAGVKLVTFEEAAKGADVIILATAFMHAESALRLGNVATHSKGKIVVDVTNPLKFDTGRPETSIGHPDSAGATVQRWLAEAKVVKVWNSIGFPYMIDPKPVAGTLPDMWICGNDVAAKTFVKELLHLCGWPEANVIDAGGIHKAAQLEALCQLNCDYAIDNFVPKGLPWVLGFKLLRE
jgi:hypothetical protein